MLRVEPIRALRDNYIWCIRDASHAAIVDPGDAAPVFDYLARENLALVAILNTHHHADHVGGNRELLQRFPVPIFGPRMEAITSVTRPVDDGDLVAIPELEVQFSVIGIPGHTRGHAAYYGANILFCGDTLFGCGCGKLFEGTAAEMHSSLSKLAALPGQTRVFCGHEYTLANIAFAKEVDRDNRELLEREKRDREAPQGITLPSTIACEKATNPFLRCEEPAIVTAASTHAGKELADPVDVFAEIRHWKDNFRQG